MLFYCGIFAAATGLVLILFKAKSTCQNACIISIIIPASFDAKSRMWFNGFGVVCTWHAHYSGVIMSGLAPQISRLTIVYSTVYSGADQRKHQSSASLAFFAKITMPFKNYSVSCNLFFTNTRTQTHTDTHSCPGSVVKLVWLDSQGVSIAISMPNILF